jgi:hypothetical protein
MGAVAHGIVDVRHRGYRLRSVPRAGHLQTISFQQALERA